MRLIRRFGMVVAGVCFLAGGAYLTAVAIRWARFRGEPCRITPLMYHAVVPDERRPARYWMRASTFSHQMDQLQAVGAVTPPVDSIAAWLGTRRDDCPFPPRSVIITFDLDGPSYNQELVLPILRQHGFTAVFFVPLFLVDRKWTIKSSEIRALAEAGLTIGSHTEYHRDMRFESPDSMVASIQRTRDSLARLSGQAVPTLSAPGGRYDARVASGVRRAGTTSFFTSDPCYITTADTAGHLCRIEIRGDGGMSASEALSGPWDVAVQATQWAIKRRVEAIVGRRIWFLFNYLRREAEGQGY